MGSSRYRRRAFTMIELIVVIAILGILAAVAIVGYGAVTSKAKDASVDQSAKSFLREYRAIDGLDASTAAVGTTASRTLLDDVIAAGDVPSSPDLAIGYCPASGVSVSAPVDLTTRVEFSKGGRVAILDLATGAVALGSSSCA